MGSLGVWGTDVEIFVAATALETPSQFVFVCFLMAQQHTRAILVPTMLIEIRYFAKLI